MIRSPSLNATTQKKNALLAREALSFGTHVHVNETGDAVRAGWSGLQPFSVC